MKNAKDEYLAITEGYQVIAASISFGGTYGTYTEDEDSFSLKPLYTKYDYDNFLKFLDRDYNNGYGGQELFGVIFCEEGIWFDRGEYDGSEWWVFNQYPNLRRSFSETEVLKYERSKKLKKLNV